MSGDRINGFTVAQTISKNGVRVSSARAFLTPFEGRKNLHVIVNATVTKVRTLNKRATGVDVLIVRNWWPRRSFPAFTRRSFFFLRTGRGGSCSRSGRWSCPRAR